MRSVIAAIILGSVFLGAGSASAEECSARCDYWHNYGPYDFSYISPGLIGYPRCDRFGNCSPYLVYVYPGHRYGRVTVRPAIHPKP